MTTGLTGQSTDWSDWARRAAPRRCEACDVEFQPNHPRRRFCGRKECPGRRRADSAPRRRRANGRAQAALRAASVQGFMGEVLVEVHSGRHNGTLRSVVTAGRILVAAERGHASAEDRRRAVVVLCAAGAVRAMGLRPPTVEDDVARA